MKNQDYIVLQNNPYLHTIIDKTDCYLLNLYAWVSHQPGGPDGFTYAICPLGETKGQLDYLHRRLLDLGPNSPRKVFHKNGDTLDNRRSNLILDRDLVGETDIKIMLKKAGKKGPKGYHWDAKRGKYFAVIYIDDVRHYLGSFDTPQEARAAWDTAKKKAYTDKHEARNQILTGKVEPIKPFSILRKAEPSVIEPISSVFSGISGAQPLP